MDLPVDLVGTEGGLVAMAGVLVVLALVDSTSFGTLLVPVWLLLAPGRVRSGRVLAYLGTVAVAYLLIGVAVLLGAGVVLARFGDVLESRPVLLAQLVLGVGLLALSFRFDGKRSARRAEAAGGRPGRLARWRGRALGLDPGSSSVLPLMGLALGAVTLEAATMLPYLAAIGLLTASDLATPVTVGILALYCVVMVLPALLLLGGRLVAARWIDPLLRRLERWLSKNAAEMTGWVLGVVGVLLALDAVGRLGWT
ncbi:Sap-like sulfolipid-1-addressing protein [Isoptericola sp. CG 20/1183]|uniref:Sap-like sulfolipid-1-addressing protein n=1 Tax=Isoptericola halotolerans TaxID=300560 RepID=A0ABX5EI32_9MICO|nr:MULTISPECIES: GAP family protein [Isoptericola]PRZ09335.1 Sap-like sulfolipid-1-addressing protein [Isoptericola sp. CG 20/1183]PRZ10136.1 Sap-like sulfolipid-1-addressing protein [Isoptericola halotolerans]